MDSGIRWGLGSGFMHLSCLVESLNRPTMVTSPHPDLREGQIHSPNCLKQTSSFHLTWRESCVRFLTGLLVSSPAHSWSLCTLTREACLDLRSHGILLPCVFCLKMKGKNGASLWGRGATQVFIPCSFFSDYKYSK